MPKKQIATQEAVAAAVEKLAAEGLEPTLERVRAKLGGGSYTTINRALAEIMQARQTGPSKITEIPADLIEIGQKAVAAVYTAVQRQAMATIESIEADTRRQIEAAQAARAEASLEIERLERELESAAEDLEQARQSAQEATSRAERAEARSEAQQSEVARLSRDLASARVDVETARASARETEQHARKAEQDARREAEIVQRALTKAEAGLDAAQERHQRNAETIAGLQTELEEIRRAATSNVLRAERADAALAVHGDAMKALRLELTQVREDERQARVEAAELRGQIRTPRAD